MKTQILRWLRLLTMGMAILPLAVISSCKNDDDKGTVPGSAKYVIANVVGAFPNQTAYVQPLADLNLTSVNTGNALEIAKPATFWGGSGSIFSTEFGAPATLKKYKLNGAGQLEEDQKMLLPGTNTFSSIEFISTTEAIASTGGGLAQVIAFNPADMRITGYVDIKKTILKGASSVFYAGSAVVGSKMFLSIASFDGNFTEAFDSCHIAVIDIATKKLEKVIADPRTGHAFGNGPLVSVFQKDANGDLYVQGMGYTAGSGRSVPSGILRIKRGETNFDPAYFFDLQSVTGKNCYGLYHFGNGLTFTTRIDDPNGLYSDPVCKFMKIDLTAKTAAELPGVPAVIGGSSSLMRKVDNNTILFNVDAGTTGQYMYQYNIPDGAITKKFDMPGSCFGFEVLP